MTVAISTINGTIRDGLRITGPLRIKQIAEQHGFTTHQVREAISRNRQEYCCHQLGHGKAVWNVRSPDGPLNVWPDGGELGECTDCGDDLTPHEAARGTTCRQCEAEAAAIDAQRETDPDAQHYREHGTVICRGYTSFPPPRTGGEPVHVPCGPTCELCGGRGEFDPAGPVTIPPGGSRVELLSIRLMCGVPMWVDGDDNTLSDDLEVLGAEPRNGLRQVFVPRQRVRTAGARVAE